MGRSWLIPEGPAPRLRYLPTRANAQPAVAAYALTPYGTRFVPLALDVLTLRDGLIGDVTAFGSPEVFEAFGLPTEFAA